MESLVRKELKKLSQGYRERNTKEYGLYRVETIFNATNQIAAPQAKDADFKVFVVIEIPRGQ